MPRQNHLAGCAVASGDLCNCEPRRYMRLLWVTLAIFAFQIIGGVMSGSIALFSDSVHVLSDGFAALISIYVAKEVLRQLMSYADEHRLRLFWARVSGLVLLAMLAYIAYEAIGRLRHPTEVVGWGVVLVATIGAAGNLWQHTLIPHSHDRTARAQRLHIEGDLYSSIAVILGGAAIWIEKDWNLLDPILSLVIVAAVGWRTVRMMMSGEDHAH